MDAVDLSFVSRDRFKLTVHGRSPLPDRLGSLFVTVMDD
jgi:hypothetical protein